jgi:glycosyltransferase involved in cell wall biosynthesis
LSKQPRISVVIPSCDRPEALRSCLMRLAPGAQTLPPEFYEVIITDDSASDSICDVVAKEFPWARWIRGPRRGPAANRNCGAKAASSEWIAFTDDDCVPQNNWLFALAREMAADDADLLEGRTICPDRTNALLEDIVENPRGKFRILLRRLAEILIKAA